MHRKLWYFFRFESTKCSLKKWSTKDFNLNRKKMQPWLTRVNELSDSHIDHMMILCFRVQYCWSERWTWREKKKRHKGLWSICSMCRHYWYERWKWEGKRDTKHFSKHMRCTQMSLVSKMGMRRKEETHTTSFEAYANLLGMSFPRWPSS